MGNPVCGVRLKNSTHICWIGARVAHRFSNPKVKSSNLLSSSILVGYRIVRRGDEIIYWATFSVLWSLIGLCGFHKVANENTHIKDTHSKFVIHYEISSVGRAQAF